MPPLPEPTRVPVSLTQRRKFAFRKFGSSSMLRAALADVAGPTLDPSLIGGPHPVSARFGNETLNMPAPAVRLLRDVLYQMAHGRGVALTPLHAELTTSQAADPVQVSRTRLVQLLDEGQKVSESVQSESETGIWYPVQSASRKHHCFPVARPGGKASRGRAHDRGFFTLASGSKTDNSSGTGSTADRQKIECREEMYLGNIDEFLDFDVLVGPSKVMRCQPTDHRGNSCSAVKARVGCPDPHVDGRFAPEHPAAGVNHGCHDRFVRRCPCGFIPTDDFEPYAGRGSSSRESLTRHHQPSPPLADGYRRSLPPGQAQDLRSDPRQCGQIHRQRLQDLRFAIPANWLRNGPGTLDRPRNLVRQLTSRDDNSESALMAKRNASMAFLPL